MTLTVNQIPSHHHRVTCAVCFPASAETEYNKFANFFSLNDLNFDCLVASDNNIQYDKNSKNYNSRKIPDSVKNDKIIGSTGSGQSHNNMPQYIGCVVWKRTA